MNQKSGLIIIITPQEGLGPSSCSSFDELGIIKRFNFFSGTTKHRQYRQANGTDSQSRWPFYDKNKLTIVQYGKTDKAIRVDMLMCGYMFNEDDFGWFDGLI